MRSGGQSTNWYDVTTGKSWLGRSPSTVTERGDRGHSIQPRELENPGRHLEVDLGARELAGRPSSRILIERGDHDWLAVHVEDDRYVADAGPLNLGEAIAAFRDWALNATPGETA